MSCLVYWFEGEMIKTYKRYCNGIGEINNKQKQEERENKNKT
jgi:hypothetical protein